MLTVNYSKLVTVSQLDDSVKPSMVVKLVPDLPKIGSKFVGVNHFIDTQNNSSWSVMQPLTNNEIWLQKLFLQTNDKKIKAACKALKKSVKIAAFGHVENFNYKPSKIALILRAFYRWL